MIRQELSATKSQASSTRWLTTALVLIAWLGLGLSFYAPSPLFPLIMDTYHVNRATVGLLIGGPALFQAMLTIPGTLLASRWGAERTFAIGLLLLAAGVVTPFVTGFYQLLILRFMLGAAAAILLPLSGSILFRLFPTKYMPVLTGLSFFAINGGNGVGLLIVLPLAGALGWKVALGMTALLPCAALLAWLVLLPRIHTPAGRLPAAKLLGDAWQLVTRRNTLLLALAVMGPWAATNALVSWLPTYFFDARQTSIHSTSTLIAVALMATVPVNVLAAILTARVGLRKPFLIASAFMLAAGGMASFLSPTLAIAFVGFLVFFAGARCYLPALFSIPAELPDTSAQRVGVMWSIVFAIGNSFSAVSPSLVGYLRSQTGSYIPGLFAGALVSGTLLVSAILLPETGPGRRRHGTGK